MTPGVARAFLVPAVALLILAATNRYEGQPHADPPFVQADAYSYFRLAESAPALPEERLAFHHAQRIAIPYLLGVLHHVVPIPLHRLFQISAFLIAAAILAVLTATLHRLSVHPRQAALVVLVQALNPWAIRPYLTFPEMINDLGFVLGLAILLHGLVSRSAAAVLLGQLAASASRQTGLFVLPVLAVWLWRDRHNWGDASVSKRLTLWSGAAGIAAGVYLVTADLAARFAEPDMNLRHITGSIAWLAGSIDPFVLGAFLARAVISPLIPIGMLVLATRFRRRGHGTPNLIPLLLFAGACVSIQPLLAGPEVTGGNAPRLTTLGLLPVCLALGLALRDAGAFTAAGGRRKVFAMAGFLAAASLHHWYVMTGDPSLVHKTMFAATYILGCMGCFALTALDVRDRLPAHGR